MLVYCAHMGFCCRSLAKLAYRPPASSLQQLSDASLAVMGSCSAQDLSLTAYSFAVLGFKPPEGWWVGFWASSGAKMEQASSQGLANMFWALGRLKKVSCTVQSAGVNLDPLKHISSAVEWLLLSSLRGLLRIPSKS